ncbi:MAG: DUF481 domain-containing protein [Bacteroidales bacterium]|nr:DUF481 domain-containing protein [Bacteroidales bacterium]MCF8403943.1 DUF481 domain-containing protein [Bacteroidales bacterium]
MQGFADKTDTVYLYNGDRITGEIKGFGYGIMDFNTDGMGTLNIEFKEIASFYSNAYFDIRLYNGFRYFGSFRKAEVPGFVNIVTSSDSILKPLVEIVEFLPIKRVFWKRIKGGVDIGYSFTKANSVSRLNFTGDVEYRYEKNYAGLHLSSNSTTQDNSNASSTQDYTLNINRFFTGKSFAGIYGGAQSSTEQGINLRLLLGGGIGSNLIYTNHHKLKATMGSLLTQEYSKDDSISRNVEGLLQLQYKIFKFTKPEVNVTTNFNLYPSFTTRNRYRVEYDLKAKLQIISDLYFSVSLYYMYDNKPLNAEASKDDYGLSTAIGYSF